MFDGEHAQPEINLLWQNAFIAEVESSRTHFQVLGLGLEASSPRPWPRSLQSLALASKTLGLRNLPCPWLEDRTILMLKFCRKTLKTWRKICEHLFRFSQLEHRCSKREAGGPGPSPIEISPIAKMWQNSLLFLQFQFLFSIFRL